MDTKVLVQGADRLATRLPGELLFRVGGFSLARVWDVDFGDCGKQGL